MSHTLVFTDLDNTLLNHQDYGYTAAVPALQRLAALQIPVILVSSKTAGEMLSLREEMHNQAPFVCENGSLVVIPEALLAPLGLSVAPDELLDGYHYSFRGATRAAILKVLAALQGDYDFLGFAQMSVQEIVDHTGLPPASARLAARRVASEPIIWRDTEQARTAFTAELTRQGLRLLKGGRFYHVMGLCDKGDAVRYLQSLYQHQFCARPYSIALGDSPNDLDMLKQVDAPVIMPDQQGAYMQDDALQNALRAPYQGAQGWNAAVLQLLAQRAHDE